jgi:ssDNA-binding Zn-finger/Zn-ribbon topoisomerase 1
MAKNNRAFGSACVCLRCGWIWWPRGEAKRCARCKSPYWRTYRKQPPESHGPEQLRPLSPLEAHRERLRKLFVEP